MDLLFQHWSLDPALVGVGLAAFVHAVGHRRRLRAVRRAGRPVRELQLRAVAFYAGLAVLVIAIDSPIDYWAESYLIAHMLQHILLAFGAPPLIVVGAPWLALRRGLPAPGRLLVARFMQWARQHRRVRAFSRGISHPIVALIAFNAVMVAWHVPYLFDLAERNQMVHVWVDHTSMFATGLLLWVQLLESPPFHPRWHPLQRGLAAFVTNAVMVGVAMTLVLFSHVLYPVYLHQAHTLFNAYADQQIAGSVLWICGEFSLAPTIYWNEQLWFRSQRPIEAGKRPTWSLVLPWQRQAARWVDPTPAVIESGWRPKLRSRRPG